MQRFLFLLIVSLVILSSCGGDDERTMQKYPIHVINGITEESMADTEVSLSWNVGSQNVDFVEGITDQNGMVELETSVNLDSVDIYIENTNSATQDWIHQNINVTKEGYSFYEVVQRDSAMFIFRNKFFNDELITAKVFENVPFNIKIEDVAPFRERSYLIWTSFNQFHPAFSFENSGSSIHVFELGESDTDFIDTNLADGVDYRIDFILCQYDTLNDRLDTLSITPKEIKIDKNMPNQEIVYEF